VISERLASSVLRLRAGLDEDRTTILAARNTTVDTAARDVPGVLNRF
jgi:hypothetical protein